MFALLLQAFNLAILNVTPKLSMIIESYCVRNIPKTTL